MRVPGQITKTDSETVVGEDEFRLPVVECPEVKLGRSGRYWHDCMECGNNVLHEVNGKSYYHKLSCSKSNGIGYNDERSNTTLPHHAGCNCLTCEPPKSK
jgi:hypothetical protein